MTFGKTRFTQIMEYVPWETFEIIIESYDGDSGARRLKCAETFRMMAFLQLIVCGFRT